VLVVACVKGRMEELTTYRASEVYGSIYPGVWSFMLALRSRGLASAFTTVHTKAEKEMGEVLGIPEGVTQAALIPVAHLKGDGPLHRADRRPIREVAYADRWGVPLQ
jgi:nitroreductase